MSAFIFSRRLRFLLTACAALIWIVGCASPGKQSAAATKSTHSKIVTSDFPDAATAGLLPPPQHK